jgi:hypothetical protein
VSVRAKIALAKALNAPAYVAHERYLAARRRYERIYNALVHATAAVVDEAIIEITRPGGKHEHTRRD